ncbi:MAG: tetratricopeptide repeat protein [bacterium]
MRQNNRKCFPLLVEIVVVIFSSSFFVQGSEHPRKAFPPPKAVSRESEPTFADFVGSEACAECHKSEYQVWKNSTHGRAGGPATNKTVIGKFDSQPLIFKDAKVVPFTNKKGEFGFAVEQEGFAKKFFRADFVVGRGHMVGGGTQTYFSRFPDGTIRFLPFDFIRQENLWFGETKHAQGWIPIREALAITDLSEWPPSRILGANLDFNNCQECHGSQIQTRYDAEMKRYLTEFKSLSINCESCHGPGKRHVELAKSGNVETLEDIGMKALSTLSKDASLEVCFRCHALKDVLEAGYLPGKVLPLYYSLKFPMLGGNPYFPDGRIRAFGYQQNHLYSDCYLNGSMTCVDCHDPHSQTYRDVNGRALHGRFDNGQCTGCHASKVTAAEKHSHHPSDSLGNQCTSCHMPFLQHKAMGKYLRFARSDHTIPIPRPEFDAKLGVENACKKCHQDKTIAELQVITEEWYGKLKPHKPAVASLLQAEKSSYRLQAVDLLSASPTDHPMAHMAALSFYLQRYVRPDMPALDPAIVAKLQRLCEAEDLDLQALALASLHFSQDKNDQVHNFLVEKVKSLDSDEMLVRKRWAVALAFIAKQYREKGELGPSISVYEKALEVTPENADILVNLGIAHRDNQDFNRALACFEKALHLKPSGATIWVNLGLVYQRMGDAAASAAAYKKAIDINPWNAKAYFNLGNHYYRMNDLPAALASYSQAVAIDPNLALGYFNLARAYIKTKELRKALLSVRAGLQYDPNNQSAKNMLHDLEAYLNR